MGEKGLKESSMRERRPLGSQHVFLPKSRVLPALSLPFNGIFFHYPYGWIFTLKHFSELFNYKGVECTYIYSIEKNW